MFVMTLLKKLFIATVSFGKFNLLLGLLDKHLLFGKGFMHN